MAIPRNLANIAPHMNASSTELTVNDGSADLDFRVESDGNQNAIFVDAGANKVNFLSNAGRGNVNVNGRLALSSATSNGFTLAAINDSNDIYVNPSTGNDSTGNGSSGSPYQTVARAIADVPKYIPRDVGYNVRIQSGTFTINANIDISGYVGGGSINLFGAGETSTYLNLNGYTITFNDCQCITSVREMTINQTTGGGYALIGQRCNYFRVYNTVTINKDGSPGWNYALGCFWNNYSYLSCDVLGLSGYAGGLGGMVVLYGGYTLMEGMTISKAGSRIGSCGLTLAYNAYVYWSVNTINNFNQGIEFQHHYGNNISANIMIEGGAITNCGTAIYRNYAAHVFLYTSPTFSGNTLNNEYYTSITANNDFSQLQKLLIGYNQSNGSYNLQVNSQIFATSATIATSDGRYKEQVVPLTGALDLVSKLNPVQFKWKPHEVHNFDTENVQIGFIAQEVMQAMADKPYLNGIIKTNKREIKSADIETVVIEPAIPPKFDSNGIIIEPGKPAVTEEKILNPAVTEDFYGIAESNLVAILTKAIQELKGELDAVKAELAALKQA